MAFTIPVFALARRPSQWTAALFFGGHVSAVAAVFSGGAGTLEIHYQGGQLNASWDLVTGAIVDGTPLAGAASFAPGALLVFTGNPFTPRPTGAGYDPLGVPVGAPIWDIPQALTAGEPQIALGADTLNPADWANFTLSLVGLSGPGGGAFSTYLATVPVPLVQFASADGLTASDSLNLVLGGHSHHTFAFTQPGLYLATLEWQGLHVVDGLKSTQATIAFGVTVIPEPGAAALGLGLAALVVGVWRRRRSGCAR